MNNMSGVAGAPNGKNSSFRPAALRAEFNACRNANTVDTANVNAGSPVANKNKND